MRQAQKEVISRQGLSSQEVCIIKANIFVVGIVNMKLLESSGSDVWVVLDDKSEGRVIEHKLDSTLVFGDIETRDEFFIISK